ncbi:MAG: carbamoyl-phosphate synthase subunit L, partial [Ponticaulis sp.]|nr:carbamoyl-phosphate synthase subunit L [Ponticaulis sp.]
MPGKLLAIRVKAGDSVTKDQPLAVMEAMKMEHTLSAPRDGEIAEVADLVGAQVAEGELLVRLVPES